MPSGKAARLQRDGSGEEDADIRYPAEGTSGSDTTRPSNCFAALEGRRRGRIVGIEDPDIADIGRCAGGQLAGDDLIAAVHDIVLLSPDVGDAIVLRESTTIDRESRGQCRRRRVGGNAE